MTIRRDIQKLAAQGIVQPVHGGARAGFPIRGEYSFYKRLEKNREAKIAVARRAYDFVDKGAITAFDSGTTVLELARILPNDLELTVVTYSLPILNQLSNRDNIELISLGGVLLHNTQSFIGPLAILALRELRISTFFLATKAIQAGAIYSGNPYDAEVKRMLIGSSDKVILLVDSTKFHNSAGVRVASLDDIHVIIVDDGINKGDFNIPGSVEMIVVPIVQESS
jgi:DeoR/GlpR family transcriptional regulator of sugar metabolism